MKQEEALISIALDLTASLASEDRHHRLLEAVRQSIPCDAAAILRLEGEDLVPVSTYGLTGQALTRRFPPRDHPRLQAVLHERAALRFPPDSDLPDPFDGLLSDASGTDARIHACLVLPLIDDDEVVGALTADALEPHAFDDLDESFLKMLGALAGAAIKTSQLIEALEALAARKSLVARDLHRAATQRSGVAIIGTSPVIERMRQEIELVADSDFSVVILGETGVGKELVARAIHAASARCEEPLIYVNCAALPESLAEAELFGHLRGAFTGANTNRAGKFEVADGGTLLLDEVGELPLSVQPKLLRALQEGEIQRVGADRLLRVDVRILAATNRDLAEEVKRGRFRSDLYHRLLVYPIEVPALRHRRQDIPLLTRVFLDRHRRRLGLGEVGVGTLAEQLIMAYEWPGNVRELDHVLGRAALRAKGDAIAGGFVEIAPHHLDLHASSRPKAGPSRGKTESVLPTGAASLTHAVDDYRRELVRAALERTHGNWAAAARSLGLHRSNLHHLARRLGMREVLGERQTERAKATKA